MDQKSYDIRRDHWRQIILECNNREAGITKKQWCQMNGIGIKSLYYWQRQFRNDAVSSIESAIAVSETDSPAFVDITKAVSTSASDSECSAINDSALIPELMIQTAGCRIYVSGAVQERTLGLVMSVLNHA